jgi:hypothetical protein
LILSEEVCIRDVGEASCSIATLNLENQGRGEDRNSGHGISNSMKGISKSKFRQQLECWNCGKTNHFKKYCRKLKKKIDNNAANGVAIEEVHDMNFYLLRVLLILGSWTQELLFILR